MSAQTKKHVNLISHAFCFGILLTTRKGAFFARNVVKKIWRLKIQSASKDMKDSSYLVQSSGD